MPLSAISENSIFRANIQYHSDFFEEFHLITFEVHFETYSKLETAILAGDIDRSEYWPSTLINQKVDCLNICQSRAAC